jgi:hypothetical protein
MYKYCPVLSGKQDTCAGCKYDGKQAYECAQLTRYSCKADGQELVSGANNQWTKTDWHRTGTIDSLPDVPGVLLYHANSTGRMTHTGVYVGGGYAVEARGHAYGVVETKVSSRSWTHWGALPGVLGEVTETAPETPENGTGPTPAPEAEEAPKGQGSGSEGVFGMKTLRHGSRGMQVRMLQYALTVKGFEVEDDGIFGVLTKLAVGEFQKANGLAVDYIVGPKTWTKLTV